MVKISVITPTVRHEGLPLVSKGLKRQTFKEYEWIIVSPKEPKNVSFDLYLKDPKKEEGDVWTLNKAYNAALKAAKGELIVSWQDWTFTKHDTLEKLWGHYTEDPKCLVGAVGNKYEDETWAVMTWKDPRERDDQGSLYPCYFSDIEWNLCCVPKQALFDVGGFDEKLDKYFGMDAYSVNERINILGGYDFKLDQTIKTYSLEHKRPKNWEENNALHGPYNSLRSSYIENPKLSYL